MAKEEGAPAEPKSKKKLLLVILPLVLVLVGGAAGAYFFLWKKKPEATAATEEKAPPPPKTFVFYNLPGLVVNLPAAAGRTSFLKITLSLELESATDVTVVQAVMPRIVDNIQSFLRELRPEDLKGTAALTRLRGELLARVADAAPNAKVDDVLLQELLLQ